MKLTKIATVQLLTGTGATIAIMVAPAAVADGTHHGDPDYASTTGARVGPPWEQEVSTYGGSHKHLWVEQQLYGPGVVTIPRADTTVHQSR